jgi:hypothetical protein
VKKISSCVLLLILVWGCSHEPAIPSDPVVSYSKDVAPIILNNCATTDCHSSTGRQHERPLETYSEVMKYVNVTGVNAYKCRLMDALTSLNGDSAMPPNQPLPETQLKLIYIWILQGAKDN